MKTIKETQTFVVYYEAVQEGGYVALVPALPGCHSQGETLEEAEHNITEAIELCLEVSGTQDGSSFNARHAYQGVVSVAV